MYEVEVKVRADHGAIGERLEEAGAEPRGTVVQEDTYYDHPARSFAATDEALRIRRGRRVGDEAGRGSDGETVLTYKGPRVEDASKTREEVETVVDDATATGDILEVLGFEPVAGVRKERERHALDGYLVSLDRVDGLGEFVEVEAEGSADDVDRLRDGANDLLERLGVDPGAGITDSYLELLLDE